MKKRLLRVLLMCCMVLTMLPTTAFAATQNYNLWIGGDRVTSENLSGDGWKFEPETNTLVLNGFGLATWGYNMGKDFLGHYPQNVNMFAIIYAEGKMDLTIRTEGKESYIGDPDFANRAYEKSKRAYTAIYNSGGTVTITGDAKLTVGANYRGIFCDNSGTLIFDNARDVEVVTFGGDTLHARDITVKGNSHVNTTVGHAGAGVPTMNIYATYTVKVYAGSSLKSDFELGADTSGSDYAGIKCISGKNGGGVYAYGGEIRSQVYPAGYDIGDKTLYAIDAPVVNIEGDGVVDGNIYNWYNPNEYYVNSVVYGFSGGSGKVKFNGPGILRLKMSTAKPDGSSKIQQLRPDSISFAENLLYRTDTDGSCREEITAYTCDGIFLTSKGVYQYWSYSEKNLYPTHYGEYYGSVDLKSDALNLKDVVTKTPNVSKLVVMENSTNMVNPNVDEEFEIPEMTVKSGATLTLKFDKDRDYTFTKPIYLEGGTLEINGGVGSGIIKGLDVRGNGTVIFHKGTVSGDVEKTVKVVMDNETYSSGNIDIPDYGNVMDGTGNTVHKFAYKAETEYDYFRRVCIIREVEERDFLWFEGKFHIAENGDKMLYLWTDRADRPHRIGAYPTADCIREDEQTLSLKYGTNTFAPGTPFTLKENGVFVAKAGDDVVLSPLAGGNPTDLQKSFVSLVKWYVSKDGGESFELVQRTQGPTADNTDGPYASKTIRFEYVLPEITEEQNGYIYRCEVCYWDAFTWERTSYYYDATLYVDTPQLKEPDRYVDGQSARLEMTHGTTLDGVTFGYRWELSRSGGIRWETVQEGTSAVYETAAVTDAMEGWQIRVVYSIYANGKKLSEGTTDPVTIDAIGKRPVITEHPKSVVHRLTEVLDDNFPPDPDKITIAIDTYYSFSVKAEGENLHYRWQRSKDNGRTFEDLPDEDEARTKGWYKVAAGTTWQYRCIVYNDFGSVISNVATTRTLYPPTTSNPRDLTVPEHTDAVFRVDITQGLPYGTDVIWQVSKDGKTMQDVTAEDGTVNVYSESVNGSINWYTTLTISDVSQDMSGYMYRCIVKNQPNDEDYNGLRRSWHATLTVTYSCAANGHKFDAGTVTSKANCTDVGCKVFTCSACGYVDERVLAPLGHDWKAATCRSVKTCQREGCGVSEGGFNYTNHTGKPVWSHDDGGHTSKWNCCNTPDQPYSPHIYADDADMICNVCGYDRTVTPSAHEHVYGDWSHDAANHWHECTDADCPDKSESIRNKEAHIYTDDADTICSICGYDRTATPPAPTEHTVTVTTDGNGTVSVSLTTAAAGTEISLTATPDAGYRFKEWQVISGGVTITNNKFTMLNDNVEVKAIFEEDTPPTPTDPAKPNISIAGTYTYNGSEHTATVVGFDSATMDISGNTGTDAGDYTISVTSKTGKWAGGDTEAVTAAWNIGKATREVPSGLSSIAPTTEDSSDGKITGVTNEMEYRMAGESSYTACSGVEIENLSSGTYFVRYAEDNNHFASPDAAVTVGEGMPLADCTITFNGNGGDESMNPVTVKAGTNYILPTCGFTAPANQEFKAWEIDSTEYKVGDTYTVSGDTEIKALWEISIITPTTYTVTVTNDGNGTGAASPSTAEAGTEITLTATPNAGYHFKEWQIISGGMTIKDDKFNMPDGNVGVKAIFEEDAPPVPIEYTVTFDGNGGTPSVGSMTTTDQKLVSLPGASRSGRYSFDGWYTKQGGGARVTTDTVFSANTTVYARWTYTGGSSSGSTTSKTETTTNPDGSTTKTETKKDGSSVTENKDASGSTATVKTDKNGSTEAEAKISEKAVEDAKKSGEAVKVPVEVKAGENSDSAPTVKIELPKNAGETKVEIPVKDVSSGTVAVIVHPDGTEEIVKNSVPTENGIQLTVSGNTTVKIMDNSKDFIDTRDHWAKAAIDFVSARGLVNGVSATMYAPNASTTRAQLWTILARQSDANLTGGNTWYEKAQAWSVANGISDGTNPNGTITRAQMVTMLWRTAGSAAAESKTGFTDVPAGSYYAQAVAWAVENGITAGVGNGRFDPNATCTRAQIATFLARSMK